MSIYSLPITCHYYYHYRYFIIISYAASRGLIRTPYFPHKTFFLILHYTLTPAEIYFYQMLRDCVINFLFFLC